MRKELEADRVSLKDDVQFDSLQIDERKYETTSKSTSSLKPREIFTIESACLCMENTLLILFLIALIVGPIYMAYADRVYNGSWSWTIIACSAFGVSIIVSLVVYYCEKKNSRSLTKV